MGVCERGMGGAGCISLDSSCRVERDSRFDLDRRFEHVCTYRPFRLVRPSVSSGPVRSARPVGCCTTRTYVGDPPDRQLRRRFGRRDILRQGTGRMGRGVVVGWDEQPGALALALALVACWRWAVAGRGQGRGLGKE
jgi:hypothetical protein